MSKKVVIIDYHLGNLFSVQQACRHVGFDAVISSDKEELLSADYAILPGVGAFGDAMDTLHRLDLVSPIHDFVQSGRPFMGVCLGLQLLFSESEEFGSHKGLNIIEGITRRFPANNAGGRILKVPQIEWNQLSHYNGNDWSDTPLQDCTEGEYMYFVHSYYVIPVQKEYILSTTTYGGLTYCSSAGSKNVFACQFHPERSAEHGLKIYRSFLNQ
jgi:imidazole glycerol-phosphate synthase subunit HisH